MLPFIFRSRLTRTLATDERAMRASPARNPHAHVIGRARARHACWLIASLSLVMLSSRPAAAQNLQIWDEVDVAASWRTLALTVPVVLRTDTALPNPQLVAGGLLADVQLPHDVTLTAGYLVAELPQRANLRVQIPLVAAAKTFRVGRLVLNDRNRLERLDGFGTSPFRYRNRLLLDSPLGAGHRWHMFGDDEVFFDFSQSAWTQNRFRAGAGIRMSSRAFLDAYYLLRSVRGGLPNTHVIGTTFRVALTASPE